MDKSISIRILQEIAEEDIPSSTVNLLPIIRNRVEKMENPHYQENSRPKNMKAITVGITLFIIAMASLVMLPPVRAAIQEFVYGFIFADQIESDGSNTYLLEPTRIANSQPTLLDLDEIQQHVPFEVKEPSYLPNNLVRSHSNFQTAGDGQIVVLRYSLPDSTGLEEQSPSLVLVYGDGDLSSYLIDVSETQDTQVNGNHAIYVHGGWQFNQQSNPDGSIVLPDWNSALDDAYLSWEEGGITYLLKATNLNFTMTEMLEIAESLK